MLFQQNETSSEINEGKKRRRQLVVTSGDTSELFEFQKEALDQVALLVKPPITTPRIASIGFRRDSIVGILSLNKVQDLSSSIRFIRQNSAAREINVRQNIDGNCGIVYVPARQLKIERIPKGIHNSVDFGRFTTTTRANKLVNFAVYSPFLAPALCGCALTLVESKDRFSMSASSFKAWKICKNVPSSRHLQKRL